MASLKQMLIFEDSFVSVSVYTIEKIESEYSESKEIRERWT